MVSSDSLKFAIDTPEWLTREMQPSGNDADDLLKKTIEAGIDMSGSIGGTIAGVALGGPAGGLAGAIAGTGLVHILKDVAHRTLSRRERQRVGALYIHALDAMNVIREAGGTVRQDDFWVSTGTYTSPGQQVIEGVLIAAQREPQERKLEFMGTLLARVAFEPEITADTAAYMIRTAEELTWQQYVLLALIGRLDEFEVEGIETSTHAPEFAAWAAHKQLAELGDFSRGLILGGREQTPRGFQKFATELSSYKLGWGGDLLYQSMWLDRMPKRDILEVLALLRATGRS